MSKDFFKPETWQDAKRMVESFENMETHQHSLKPSGFAKRVEIEYNKMFYLGVLYGMALEAGKDRRLEERHYFG